MTDVSPGDYALKSWSLVWNGRVGTSKRQGLSECYWVTDSLQELTLPNSQKRAVMKEQAFPFLVSGFSPCDPFLLLYAYCIAILHEGMQAGPTPETLPCCLDFLAIKPQAT